MRTNQNQTNGKKQNNSFSVNDSDKLIEKWFSIKNLLYRFSFCLCLLFYCFVCVWYGIDSHVLSINQIKHSRFSNTHPPSLSPFYSNINNDFCECNICIHFATLCYVIVSVFFIFFYFTQWIQK